MNSQGRTVRLFLAEGTAGGIVTGEIINWTGKVIAAPESRLPDLLKRPELKQSGVYFLRGENPKAWHRPHLYVGESDAVRERLKYHSSDPKRTANWDHTVVVVSKDENLTKSHIRFLEARLLSLIDGSGRAELANGTSPALPPLPEADQADMETFVDQMRIILPVVGLDIFKKLPTVPGRTDATLTGPIFELTSKSKADKLEVHAIAQLVDGEFVVREGSMARRQAGSQNSYAGRRAELVNDGLLIDHPDQPDAMLFRVDVPFASPSAAAAVVLNRNSNGRIEWRVKDSNQTYADWHAAQVESLQP
jgi:hypothetical protein